MISRISGKLVNVTDQFALVENNGLYYEIQVPSALAQRLKDEIQSSNTGQSGKQILFETIYYIEAGDRKSSHYPRLVGFTNPVDREFFSLFTSVAGMGIKKALKSLVVPIRDIAAAIETRNSAVLTKLPGVGGRMADKIIAELNGKAAKFALAKTGEALAVDSVKKDLVPFEEEALEVLIQLQYKRNEAMMMIDKVIKANPKISSAEDLISYIFKSQSNE